MQEAKERSKEDYNNTAEQHFRALFETPPTAFGPAPQSLWRGQEPSPEFKVVKWAHCIFEWTGDLYFLCTYTRPRVNQALYPSAKKATSPTFTIIAFGLLSDKVGGRPG